MLTECSPGTSGQFLRVRISPRTGTLNLARLTSAERTTHDRLIATKDAILTRFRLRIDSESDIDLLRFVAHELRNLQQVVAGREMLDRLAPPLAEISADWS